MKKILCFSIICSILVMSIIFFSGSAFASGLSQNIGKADPEAGKPDTITQLKAAGMNVHILNYDKTHSVGAMLSCPASGEEYIPAVLQVNGNKDKIISAHISRSFYLNYGSYTVKIRKAVLDKSGQFFTGQGEIDGLHLPGMLYSHDIKFNGNGIVKIGSLRQKGEWKVCGFPFTPSQIKWTKDGIESDGMLSLKFAHPEINLLIKPNEMEITGIKKPVKCLIQNQTSVITGVKIINDRIHISGYSGRYSPKNPQHFKDIMVGASGYVNAGLKKPPVAKDRNYNRQRSHREFQFADISETLMGMAGLPGEMLVKIAGTNMTMRVISEQKEGDKTLYSGYISMPPPLDRVNVYRSAKSGTEADVKDAKMYWQVEKFKIPFIDSVVHTKDPVKFSNGKIESPIFGQIKISEFIAPAAKVIADNSRIDYEVTNTFFSELNLKGSEDSILPTISTPEITFDVIQGRDWIGFMLNATLGSITFGPTNVSWYDPSTITGPSVYLEIHNTGYVKLDIVTGSECIIPIVPDIVNLVSPEIHYLRYPSLLSEYWLKGNFQPPPPILGGKIVKMVGTYYVDKEGMGSGQVGYTTTGVPMDLYLLGLKAGEAVIDFDGNTKIFVCQGDLGMFGYTMDGVSMELFLGSDSLLAKGSASTRIIKEVGVKFQIYRDGTFHLGLGHYDFKTQKGGGSATYTGPFDADSVSYNGTMTLDPSSGITMSGDTKSQTTSTGNDSVSYDFSISGTMDDSGSVTSGTISTSALSYTLKPQIPQSTTPVEIDLESLTPTFTKDPQSGEWETESGNVQVTFNYTDNNGNSQTFSQSCELTMVLNNNNLHIDLGLPPAYGGTYSQSFVLKTE